jgi:hypothetical protein
MAGLTYPVDETVIGICALVVALDTLPPRILCNSQRKAVFIAQLFQLGNRAVRKRGDTLSI